MKSFIAASFAVVSTVSAHSWVECTNHDNSQLKGWMQGNSTLSPPVIIDPAMPWYSDFCKGWPRAKKNPGNWIDESSNYIWNIGANSWNGGSYHPADTHACPPGQRSPTYEANAPMASAAPGDSIKLRFGGNGHSRGDNVGGDPGIVTVYWKGAPEQEITDISEFTEANKLTSGGFAADAFNYPADASIKSPVQGLVDKGNWLSVKLPANMAAGRHMMVWVWSYKDAPQWSTCFDVMVSGSASAPAPAAPAPAVPESNQKNPVPAPAPAPAAPAPESPAPVAPSSPAAPEPAPAPPAPAAPAPSVEAAPASESPKPQHRKGGSCRNKHGRRHPRHF